MFLSQKYGIAISSFFDQDIEITVVDAKPGK